MTPYLTTELLDSLPHGLDLTNQGHLDQVQSLADGLLSSTLSEHGLSDLEETLIQAGDTVPLMAHVAVKLARSRKIVLSLDQEFHVSVVFAVYKEQDRIRPLSEHAHGEDFLRRKLSQMDWLFEGVDRGGFDLTIVDDGCPHGSGGAAQAVLRELGGRPEIQVLYLEQAIAEKHPATAPLLSAGESQKGGAIEYGLWTAANVERKNHVLVFTDADLSTHLGQTGLLLDGILRQGKPVAIGSRREPRSVVVKQGKRNSRGKLFIYLWKRMLGILSTVVDTQCGFKAFRADLIREIVLDTIEKKFAFDIELLLKAELRQPDSICKVPIAWIDSEAASTTTDLEPYLPMLQKVAAFYRKYLPADAEAGQFADFIESLDDDAWQRLVAKIPDDLAADDPARFDGWHPYGVAEFSKLCRG